MHDPRAGQIADALERHFKARVEDGFERITGNREPFEKTGVALPGREIWEGYAKAALTAISVGENDGWA